MPDKKRILVIDDEELLIKTFDRLLEKQGYEVYTVKNGADAIVMVEEEQFDLIITDIRMPGDDGVETIKKIDKVLKDQKRQKIPIIFVTGYADEKLEKEAMQLDPVAYFHKPFDAKEILEFVKTAVSS